jgi:hypothetical protein
MSDAIRALGYAPQWSEFGLLPDEVLAAQLEAFQRGDDRNTEHFRYASFRRLLKAEGPLSDELVRQYLQLVELDPDELMARAALVDLLARPSLTDEQFDRVSLHRWHGPDSTLVRRHRLLRALGREGPTPELVERCLLEKDSQLHEALLDLPLADDALARLSRDGASRRVRNLAAAAARRR